MKRFLLFASICLSMSFSLRSNAQSNDKKTMELIMEVPKADPIKAFKALKKKLSSLPEVNVEGFCASRKLLMLRLNPEQYFNVLVAVDEAGFSYYIKKEEHIWDIMNTCHKDDLYTKESSSVE